MYTSFSLLHFLTNKIILAFLFQLKVCPKSVCISTVGIRKDLFQRNPDYVPITDFFGSIRPVELVRELVNIEPLIDGGIITNITKTNTVKTVISKSKPNKYRHVPPLVSFNTLIQ